MTTAIQLLNPLAGNVTPAMELARFQRDPQDSVGIKRSGSRRMLG